MKYRDGDYSELQKLGPLIRTLCLFICLCSALAFIFVIAAMIFEPFHYITLVVIPVFGLTLHISSNILFTGFAPKYLLFAHGKVRLDKP